MKKVKTQLLVLTRIGYNEKNPTQSLQIPYKSIDTVLDFSSSSIREAANSLAEDGLLRIHKAYGKTSVALTQAGKEWIDLQFHSLSVIPSQTGISTILITNRPSIHAKRVLRVVLREYQTQKIQTNVLLIFATLSIEHKEKILRLRSVAFAETNTVYGDIDRRNENSLSAAHQTIIKKIKESAKFISDSKIEGLMTSKKRLNIMRKYVALISVFIKITREYQFINQDLGASTLFPDAAFLMLEKIINADG